MADAKYNLQNGRTPEKIYSFASGAKELLLGGPLNLLLVCTPFAFISYWAKWPLPVTFVLSLLSIAPFAERLGYVTEQLAIHTNDTIGGLLNATFGNATELIISLSALKNGLYRVIQLSLLGSILSNLLLVMGTAFFCGGLKFKTQTYGTISGQINSTLLMIASLSLILPAVLTQTSEENDYDELTLSRVSSVILVSLYICYLYFQLNTHRDAYEVESEEIKAHARRPPSTDLEAELSTSSSGVTVGLIANGSHSDGRSQSTNTRTISIGTGPLGPVRHSLTPGGGFTTLGGNGAEGDDDDEEEDDILGFNFSIVWLAVITIFISFLSTFLVESIEATAEHVSGFFLSAIVLPIVGNAAEHASAIVFAMKNKLDLALGVAVGSSTQIAVFVLPFIVLCGWIADKPMSLNFHQFETATLLLSVITVTFAIKNGKSNWLVGATLIAAYVVIATGFLVHNNESLE